MDDVEVVLTCPLGSKCKEIDDGKIHQCRWYVKMRGIDASGEEHDNYDCAISWFPVLQTEQSQSIREMTASVQSFRNENIKRQNTALSAMRIIDGVIGEKDGSKNISLK